MSVAIKPNSPFAFITFGGFQSGEWIDPTFTYQFIKEKNDKFVVFQNGLNYYVFEADAIIWTK